MNKAILVALREYMENLRTKAFWIGILIMPVILLASFGLPTLLQKEKDTRYYAVYDPTGEFLTAVERRSAVPDMEAVFKYVMDNYEQGGRHREKLSGFLQDQAKLWDEMDEERSKEVMDSLAGWSVAFSGPEGIVFLDLLENLPAEQIAMQAKMFTGKDIDPEMLRKGKEFVKKTIAWWRNLSPEEAKEISSGLSKSRYCRKENIDISESDPEKTLGRLINDGTLFAYFVINSDPVAGIEGCKYVSNNLTDDDLKNWFTRYAADEVRSRLIRTANIDSTVPKRLQNPIRFESKQISETGEEEDVKTADIASQWAPVAFVYLLWLSVFMIAQALMTNTIEEKSNKIMEVLLSSVSPIQLMAGKIIGIAGTGLTMIGSWIIFFLIALKFLPLLFGQGPEIDFSLIIRDPIYLTSFIGYFILGYLLLSAILVGIGSVCNSLKEAQNLMMPVTLILIVPLIAMIPIGKDPNGTIAKVLSYVPPFTPFVMMNRAAGPPSTMEYVITTILLIVSIVIALWAAAKVFRVGILMTGKPPKVSEILRWIRAPVGQVHDEKRE